jgi:hypothetical protein
MCLNIFQVATTKSLGSEPNDNSTFSVDISVDPVVLSQLFTLHNIQQMNNRLWCELAVCLHDTATCSALVNARMCFRIMFRWYVTLHLRFHPKCNFINNYFLNKNITPCPFVCERTIPNELPPLVIGI